MSLHKRWLWVGIGSFLTIWLIILISLVTASALTWQSYQQIRQGEFASSAKSARSAQKIVSVLSWVTLSRISTLEAWDDSLQLLQLAPEWQQQISDIPQQLLTPNQTGSQLPDLWQETWPVLAQFQTHFSNSSLAKIFPTQKNSVILLLESVLTGKEAITHVLEKPQKIVLLLQNTDELRATGGFMGSFILIETANGAIQNWQLLDIYDPDGQFSGYMPAPAPVDQLLSQGKGLRLPDSNWWPDFPSTAPSLLSLLKAGNIDQVTILAALNLSVIEQLLAVTGPIYLPDQDITVSEHTIGEVLRSSRGDFFAGSQAKKTVLTSFMNHLLYRLSTLPAAQQQELLRTVHSNLSSKELQFFSADPVMQDWFTQLGFAGEQFPNIQQPAPDTLYLAPVESNVGINKANQFIARQTTLKQMTENDWEYSVTWHHEDSTQSFANSYVNYHRLYLNQTAQVTQVKLNGQAVSNWEEDTSPQPSKSFLKDLGILTVTKPGEQTHLAITFRLANLQSVWISKQSGILASPLSLNLLEESKNLSLTQDYRYSW